MLLAKENGVPTSQCCSVQLLAAIIGSLIVSKRNHFTLGADRHSVHKTRPAPTRHFLVYYLKTSQVLLVESAVFSSFFLFLSVL